MMTGGWEEARDGKKRGISLSRNFQYSAKRFKARDSVCWCNVKRDTLFAKDQRIGVEDDRDAMLHLLGLTLG